MNLSFFIARRYLFAKKSHTAINLISMVSAGGVAVGTFALVVVMSVYNGMDKFIAQQRNVLSPTLKIVPTKGKVFSPNDIDVEQISRINGVAAVTHILEENALLQYGAKQCVVTLYGADQNFIDHSGIAEHIVEGAAILQMGDVKCAIAGQNIAQTLDLRPHFIDLLWIYMPQRGKRIGALSMLNPEDVLRQVYVRPTGIFSVEWQSNSKYVFVPLSLVQDLLRYDSGEVSSIGLYLRPQASETHIQSEIASIVGTSFVVKNIDQQNMLLYKMMQSEKWVIFFVLMFVLFLASFNSVGALAMLIIEKRRDTAVLRAIGMQQQQIGSIFRREGMMISSLGCAVGAALGLLACVLQMRMGFIKLNGNFLVDAYPVSINPVDIALIILAVMVINYVAARLPVRLLMKRR
jgi:lipoprotein-releasing system permease protein